MLSMLFKAETKLVPRSDNVNLKIGKSSPIFRLLLSFKMNYHILENLNIY